MKKILFYLLISGLSLSAFAQQRSTLRGTVVDRATGRPLHGATVVVDSLRNGMADPGGAFAVTNIARGEALVEVYLIGYEPVRQRVDFDRGVVDLGAVGMRSVETAIGQVVVTAQANPVLQQGDTTQFNAAAFRTNPDADASSLVAKMPGMEVTESGVTAQGEAVARVYVNNELFFGDDAMAALSNLPADLVESIQMFDEQPDDARFSGFNDGRTQRALNIVTKGGRLNRTIDARLEAGYGREIQRDMDGRYQARYDIGGRLNYITPGTTVNLNGIVNNVGQMRFGGGGGRGGGRGGFGGGGSGLRTINRVGGNYTVKFDPKNSLNVSYDYNHNKNRQNSLALTDYYTTEFFNSRAVRDTVSSQSGRGSHSINLRYDHEGAKDRVRVSARGSLGSSDGSSYSVNEESRDGSPYSLTRKDERSEGSSYSVSSRVDWTHRLGEKAGRTFGVQASFSLSEDDPDGVEDSQLTKFYEGETDPTRIYWNTNGASFSRSFGLSLNYNEPLGERVRLNFNYRPSYNYSSNELVRMDMTTDPPVMDSLVSERFTYDYMLHTARMGLSYNKPDKFNFSISVSGESASRAQTMTLPRDYQQDRSFASLLPTASFRYYIRKTKYLNVNYFANSRIPSIEQLSTVVDVSDPLRYSVGNADLKQDYSHRLNIRYNTNNIERSTNFYTNIQASLTHNSIQTQTTYFTEDTVLPGYGGFTFEQGSSLRMPMNAGDAATLGAMAGYGFVFRPLKLNVNLMGSYNYSHTPSYVGQILQAANNNTATFFLGVNSNISEQVDFTAGTFANYGTTDNTSSRYRETWGQNVFGQLNYIFLGGFVVNTNYSFNTNSTLDKPYHVWSAYIGRKFLKNDAAEFRIEANDILNQSRNYSYTYNPQFETRSWNRVMGRYVMARLTYRFNSIRGQTAPQGPGDGRGEFRGDPGEFRGRREGGRPMGPPPGGM